MTRVKICGLTNKKDALLAQKLGAHITGFIFAESPRRVTIEKARPIINALRPSVHKAGIFVNEDIKKLNSAVKALKLNFVQLSGDESPAYIKQIKGAMVLKAVRVKSRADLVKQVKKYEKYADGFVFDTYSGALRGGTGKQFDWKMIKGIKIGKPFFIAGGINPGNVCAAIKAARPYGVDVSSGVEKKKGIKSPAKMRKLFTEVKKIKG
jgi:phosphoribosylanthranilate isomerase